MQKMLKKKNSLIKINLKKKLFLILAYGIILKVPPLNAFFHNIFFPIGAFILAILLWLFVISGDQYTMVLDLQIEARNLNSQKTYKITNYTPPHWSKSIEILINSLDYNFIEKRKGE